MRAGGPEGAVAARQVRDAIDDGSPMLENLSERLQGIFSGLRSKGRLTEDDINDAMREIRLAL